MREALSGNLLLVQKVLSNNLCLHFKICTLPMGQQFCLHALTILCVCIISLVLMESAVCKHRLHFYGYSLNFYLVQLNWKGALRKIIKFHIACHLSIVSAMEDVPLTITFFLLLCKQRHLIFF